MSVLIPQSQSYFFSSDPANNAKNVSSDGSSFSVQLDQPLSLPKGVVGATIEVSQASIWNNSFNISEEIGNNKMRILAQNDPILLTIPDGQYSLDGLNDFISRDLQGRGLDPNMIILNGDEATQKIVITFAFANTIIDFTIPNSVRDVLGFDARLAPTTAQPDGHNEVGDTTAHFNRVNSYLIQSNLVSNGIPVNSSASGIIASIPITVPSGSLINYTPQHPIQMDASELVGQSKNYFTFSLLDQLQRPVDTNSEYYSMVVVLRYYLLMTTTSVPMIP